MTLHIHNTLSRKKELFEPFDPKNVRIYVCGPTVYDSAHIGNARPVVVFDVLVRVLRSLYGKDHVTYVRNITDVDDKINARAAETGEDIGTITKRTTAVFHADMKALGARQPNEEPRATDHIKEMQTMIETLLDKGFAYEAEGHVLFEVGKWDQYGGLSGHNRDEIIAGARVEVAPYKKDPADFVLWKPSNEGEPGWDSAWGYGRPGWHLECSAMSRKYLGDTFDIHGGGQDLIFPHHENEIAQSRCAHGTDVMATYWMHNGYLMAEGEKMSKSLGNFYTVHDLLDEFPGEAIRLALLQTHYRQPQDFTKASIAAARKTLNDWYQAIDTVDAKDGEKDTAVEGALLDDLNTPQAITELHRLYGETRSVGGPAQLDAKRNLRASAHLMGLLWQDPKDWFDWKPKKAEAVDEVEIDAMVAARWKARTDKDFAEADRLRDELVGRGVVLKDGPDGTTWSWK